MYGLLVKNNVTVPAIQMTPRWPFFLQWILDWAIKLSFSCGECPDVYFNNKMLRGKLQNGLVRNVHEQET